jgi:hypothetical protein
MGIKELEFANENIGQLIDLHLESLREDPVRPGRVLDVCLMYRRWACGALLANHDAERCFSLLYQAADTWLQLLERKNVWPDLDPYYLTRGHAEPLLDAVAVGSAALTRRLDERMETQWQVGLESPEDFGFFRLLPMLASPTTPPDALRDGLEQLEQSLEGADYPRLDVLKALAQGDSTAFEAALVAHVDAYRARMEKARKSGTANPLSLAMDANIFIEGLALVRVARARGLRTRSQYPLIPPILLARPGLSVQPRQPVWGD